MSARSRLASLALTGLTAAVAGFGYEWGRKAGLADTGKWVNTFTSLAPSQFGNGAGNSDTLTRLMKGHLSEDDLAKLKAEVRKQAQKAASEDGA